MRSSWCNLAPCLDVSDNSRSGVRGCLLNDATGAKRAFASVAAIASVTAATATAAATATTVVTTADPTPLAASPAAVPAAGVVEATAVKTSVVEEEPVATLAYVPHDGVRAGSGRFGADRGKF